MVLLCDAISLTQFAYRLTVHFSSPGKDPSQHLGQDGMGKEKNAQKEERLQSKTRTTNRHYSFWFLFLESP